MARLLSVPLFASLVLASSAALAETPDAPAVPEAPAAPAAPEPTPVASPSAIPCGIRIARAPDDLRAAVEDLLAADPAACRGQLDVWLVPTDSGIYVQARDGLGRVRERVVPGAEVAATLIASWVEIDVAAPVWTAPEPTAEPAPAAPAPAVAIAAAPPSSATASIATRAPVPRPPASRRSYGAGMYYAVTGTDMGSIGVRADLDGHVWGNWRLSATLGAAAYDAASESFMDSSGTAWVQETGRTGIDGFATLRYSLRWGRFALVPSLALGAGYMLHEIETFPNGGGSYMAQVDSAGPRAEAALTAEVALTPRLHLGVGVANGALFLIPLGDTYDEPPVWMDSYAAGFAGLRYQR
jgi:hypothetical protein